MSENTFFSNQTISSRVKAGIVSEYFPSYSKIITRRFTPKCVRFIDLFSGPGVGGESGHKARPMKEKWVIEIRDLWIKNKIPFFFKQWGGKNKKLAGRTLDGRTYDEMPN